MAGDCRRTGHGDADGQYPAEAIETYRKALNDAKAVFDNVESSQAQIDATTEMLNKAAKTFAAARVHVDMNTLRQTILDAKKAVDLCRGNNAVLSSWWFVLVIRIKFGPSHTENSFLT